MAEADAKALEHWTGRLVSILAEAECPSWKKVQELEDPARGRAALAGAARPGTLKVRVRAWEAFRRWLLARRGRTWPMDEVDVVDYLWTYIGDRPAVSFPRSLAAAVACLEARAGIPSADRLSLRDLVRTSVEKA